MSQWKTRPLGEFADSVDYGVTASATKRAIGPKFLRITDIQDGVVRWESVPWCECDSRSANASRLKSGDIVFARTGATTGKSFLVRECPSDSVFASYLIRVRLGDTAEPRFVSHFFQTPDYWAQVSNGARGAAQPGVNATTLRRLKIPLPPLAEQRRIAEVLDRAEALRAKRRAALAQLDTLTQSLFLDLFGDPVTNPMDWQVVSLGELLSVRHGFAFQSEYFMKSGEFVLLTPGNFFEKGGYRDRGGKQKYYVGPLPKDYLLERGDMLVAMTEQAPGLLGSPVIIPESKRFLHNQRLGLIHLGDRVETQFLFHLFNSSFVRGEIQASSTGTKVKHTSPRKICAVQVPLPPLSLQREFARQMATVENLKTTHRASLAELDALFASLQHRAFRGEL